MSQPPIRIDHSEDSFSIDGVDFVIEMPPGRPTQTNRFTLAKSEPYIRFYEEIAQDFQPSGILEPGILHGGGFVLLDKIFSPDRLAAIDLDPEPVEALMTYVGDRPGRFAHFSTSQVDEVALRWVVEHELSGALDLVVDDASHTYDFTKRSFEILFPLLRPGGLYVVEDWSWAHHPDYQSADAAFADEPALTNLLLEQILAVGSNNLIAEIRVLRFLYVLRKTGDDLGEISIEDVWNIEARGRRLDQI